LNERHLLVVTSVTCFYFACGGQVGTQPLPDSGSADVGVISGGSGGTGGTSAGIAGQGGVVGAGGSVAGGAGTAGSGGASGGTSGGSGSGGTAGSPARPECTRAGDCKLLNDCCTCQAIAAGEFVPPCPPIACLVSKCEEQQLPPDRVACIAGRCVAGFECDSSKVICKSLPPRCEPGFVPAVKDGCYAGGCVPVTECLSVRSCSQCGPFPCAIYATRPGPQYHCVTVPPACGNLATCACLGPTVCTPPYTSCGDLSGVRGVTCSCPNCL
jgi:hypothetical protein